jgi:hypothetical protein
MTREKHFLNNYLHTIAGPHRTAVKGGFVAGLGFGFSQSTLFFAFSVAYIYAAALLKWKLYDPSQVLRAVFCVIFGAMASGQVTVTIF